MSKGGGMNIKFDDPRMRKLQELYNDIGKEALAMSHYELADLTGQPSSDWRIFLTDSRVSKFIESELNLIQRAKLADMLDTIEDNRSPGQAAIMNTLINQSKSKDIKEGPVFIYTYIPPNAQEINQKNVGVSDVDPFKTTDK